MLQTRALNWVDVAIVALYFAGIIWFGLRFRRGRRSLSAYFLADRNIPWWAIAVSIIAAETSSLTVIGIPGLAYDGDLTFLQVAMGYVIGRIVISVVLLPHYFRGDLYTAYELIERRFGKRLRRLAAGVFLVTRAAGEGVRVYAVSIVVAIFVGTGQVTSIALIMALTLLYTFEGGLTAVIWTDVVQTAIYIGGTLLALAVVVRDVPGGWAAVVIAARNSGKLRTFDFAFDLWKPYTFWAGIIGGAFLTTASHGTDHLVVQRLLASRGERQAAKALISSGVAILVQFLLFLILGVALFAFYRVPSSVFGRADRIYPTFIVNEMPHGVAGLLVAAILAAAMSNLSASLNSLASSSVFDFYLLDDRTRSRRSGIRVSSAATALWALVVFGVAVVSVQNATSIVELGLQIGSVAYGSLLGVFLLGILTRRANEVGAVLGMFAGLGAEVYLWKQTRVPFTWWVAIGTSITFAVGYAASTLARRT